MSDYINRYVTGPIVKVGSIFTRSSSSSPPEKIIETIIKHEYEKVEPFGYRQLPRMSRVFLRLSAISGLTAVLLSAYGSHGINYFSHKYMPYILELIVYFAL